jgi:hypothetical protein
LELKKRTVLEKLEEVKRDLPQRLKSGLVSIIEV